MAEALIARIKTTTDYYEILDVARTASDKQIKISYRKKAMLLHPDRCSLPDAKAAFQKLSNAHMCLSDKDKRRRYDVSGSDSDTPNPFSNGGAHPFAGFASSGVPFGFSPDINDLFRAAAMGGNGGGGIRFTTSGPGGVHFSFNGFNPGMRRRAQHGRNVSQHRSDGSHRGNTAESNAGGDTESLPENIKNSWVFKIWQTMLGDGPSQMKQVEQICQP